MNSCRHQTNRISRRSRKSLTQTGCRNQPISCHAMDATAIPEIRIFSPSRDAHVSSNDNQENHVKDRSNLCINGPDDKKDIHVNIFEMRMKNLTNFPTNSSAYRLHYKSKNNIASRARAAAASSPSKALNVLRATLQKSINQELDQVIQKYLTKFFTPAINNIKRNLGDNSLADYDIQAVCRNMLDDAKKMYFVNATNGLPTRSTRSPFGETVLSDAESNATLLPQARKRGRHNGNGNTNLSDNDSDFDFRDGRCRGSSKLSAQKKRKKMQPDGRLVTIISDNVDRSGPRWDPERLTTETKFVLGSKANKSLGFGMTRGRLYTKHPELYRYIGDFDDRQWLADNGFMPLAGGKAYLLVKQDIEDLIVDQYLNVPGVNAKDMGVGFTVPQFMVDKMRAKMVSEIEGSKLGSVRSSPPSDRPESAMSSRPPSATSKRDDEEEPDDDEDDDILENMILDPPINDPSNLPTESPRNSFNPTLEEAIPNDMSFV